MILQTQKGGNVTVNSNLESGALHFDTVEDATNFSNYLKDVIQAIEDTRIKVNTYRWLPEKRNSRGNV